MAAELMMWAGRTLSGSDRFGRWVAEVPDGWWDSPDSKGETADRATSDGEYDLPVYNAARLATFTGLLHAKNHDVLHEAGNYLTGAMAGRIEVIGHGGTQWADAKRGGKIRFTPLTDKLAQWQVPLRCPDPRKFGEQARFDMTPGSPATAFHRGNYKAAPIIQINGPLTGGATITHPAGQYTFLGDLASGAWVRVDMNTGRLRLNGNDRSDLVTRADLCTVLPGTVATFSLNRGTGYVEILDTFI